MKKAALFLLLVSIGFTSCKLFVKSAAKYWTAKQIDEFLGNCESNAGKLMSDEKAADYCDCAVNKVAKVYQNYADVKKASIQEVLKVAADCREK